MLKMYFKEVIFFDFFYVYFMILGMVILLMIGNCLKKLMFNSMMFWKEFRLIFN